MSMRIVIEDSGKPTIDGEYTCIKTWILKHDQNESKRLKELIHEVLPAFKTVINYKRGLEIEKELSDLEVPF